MLPNSAHTQQDLGDLNAISTENGGNQIVQRTSPPNVSVVLN